MSGPISTKTPSEIEKILSRSVLYHTLSFFLRHPQSIEEPLLPEEIKVICQKAIDTLDISGKENLKDSLNAVINELKKITFKEHARFYEDCFGHTVNSRVPIYELEYGEEHSHRQPQELADITAFYNAFGLKISEKIHERVDHAAVECEFMHYLIFKEARAIESGTLEQVEICREASRKFLSLHVGFWLPSFALRLSRRAENHLMKRIADFILNFLAQDCQAQGISCGPYNLSVRPIQEKEEAGCVSCLVGPDLEKRA